MVEHIDTLASGMPIEMPVYDFRTHTRTGASVHVEPARALILAEILILAEAALRERMDMRIFVETDDDVRLMRRDLIERGRSADSVLDQWERSVRPMHLEFVEPSRRHAHVILPEDGHGRHAGGQACRRTRSGLTGPLRPPVPQPASRHRLEGWNRSTEKMSSDFTIELPKYPVPSPRTLGIRTCPDGLKFPPRTQFV